ncbi:hypothetical protein [Micromonospora sp. WMMD812]|uniref:TolB family protein n=1 Tax=Micromonospora sp. WMMD812 TaxID=3015152 RepID=UPI00248CC7D7|nr:hypothetical protein [Micromonospora sp. WMMD812]WBB70796.1 hypothetical protein O7603_16160 [Micromonospora sp. WMMD812]
MRRRRTWMTMGTVVMLVIALPTSVANAATATPGGRILYTHSVGSTSGVHGELRSVRPDGTAMYVYSLPPGAFVYPDYSPDGTRIAYVSQFSVRTMSAQDGSDDRWLIDGPCAPASPRWSPDGTQVGFESCGDIYVASSDGPSLRNATESEFNDLQTSWAPGGKRFATATMAGVQIYRTDGSRSRTLTDLPGAWHLDWNPNGRSIAVQADGDLWLVDADTGSTRRLTDTPDITELSPTWSPDGRWLAYGRGPNDPEAGDPNSAAIDPQIWLMTRTGGRPHPIGVHGVPSSWRAAG